MASKRVALTFDMEHPSRRAHDPAAPRRILDALAEAGARATFFVQGRWARTEPELARRVVEDGHVLGSHSHFHAPLVSLTDEGIDRDVAAAAEALVEVTGSDGRPWFRCPFGAGHDDLRVQAALRRQGYRDVHWDVSGDDWFADRTADQVTRAVVDGAAGHGDGAVVLLHTWPVATAAALTDMLAELGQAWDLVGVDALLDPGLDPGLDVERHESEV